MNYNFWWSVSQSFHVCGLCSSGQELSRFTSVTSICHTKADILGLIYELLSPTCLSICIWDAVQTKKGLFCLFLNNSVSECNEPKQWTPSNTVPVLLTLFELEEKCSLRSDWGESRRNQISLLKSFKHTHTVNWSVHRKVVLLQVTIKRPLYTWTDRGRWCMHDTVREDNRRSRVAAWVLRLPTASKELLKLN